MPGGLTIRGIKRFYPSGTRRFYLDRLAEYRSPNSPLLVPPLLRLEFVGVLISVPVALVIKRAGLHTHTHINGRTLVDLELLPAEPGGLNHTQLPIALFSLYPPSGRVHGITIYM